MKNAKWKESSDDDSDCDYEFEEEKKQLNCCKEQMHNNPLSTAQLLSPHRKAKITRR
jgi:hypothetical protein